MNLIEQLRDLDLRHPLASPFSGIGERAATRIEELEGKNGRLPDRECFWLLERNVQPPQYLTDGRDLDSDPWRAMRFKTERGAHDYWRTMQGPFRDQCRPVEHMFLNKALSTPEQLAETSKFMADNGL